MVIFEKNYDKICSKYTLKRTKLHHLKKFSGHVPEPPNFVTCKIPNREKYSCPPCQILATPLYYPSQELQLLSLT